MKILTTLEQLVLAASHLRAPATGNTPWSRSTQPQALAIDRERPQTVVLEAGQRVTCSDGCLWITRSGDPRDVVLGAGECWQADAAGPVLIYALASANVSIAS